MSISESEALAIAEEAAKRALAARPAPASVNLKQAGEILGVKWRKARDLLAEEGISPGPSGLYRIEDVWRLRGPTAGPTKITSS